MLLKAEHQHTLPDFLFFLLPPLFRISEAEQFKAPSLLLPVHPHRRDQGSSPWPGGHLVYQPHLQPTHADWKLSSFSRSCLLLTPPIGSSPVKALHIPIFRKVSAVWDCPAPLWDCLWLLSPTIILEKIYKEDGTEINRPPVALLTFKQHSVPWKSGLQGSGEERRSSALAVLEWHPILSVRQAREDIYTHACSKTPTKWEVTRRENEILFKVRAFTFLPHRGLLSVLRSFENFKHRTNLYEHLHNDIFSQWTKGLGNKTLSLWNLFLLKNVLLCLLFYSSSHESPSQFCVPKILGLPQWLQLMSQRTTRTS